MGKFKPGDIVRYEFEDHYLELRVKELVPKGNPRNQFIGVIINTSDESIWETGREDVWIDSSFTKVINLHGNFEEALTKLERKYGTNI